MDARRFDVLLIRSALSSIASRAGVLVASAGVHVGVAVGLAGAPGGHGMPASREETVEIDLVSPPVEATPETIAVPPTADVARLPTLAASRPTHTHDYPVPPSHDVHDHDSRLAHASTEASASSTPALPSLEQDPARSPDPASLDHGPEKDKAMPRFVINFNHGPPATNTAGSRSSVAALGHDPDDHAAPLPESAVTLPAHLIAAARASYPDDARNAGREADVPLEIIVDKSGAVIEARLLETSNAEFGNAARTAIRRYRFSAARLNDHPVRVRMRWVVHFRLQD